MTAYEAGQASILFDYWPKGAEYFIVAGPADGDEAQTVRRKYPDIHCVGFEPNPDFCKTQHDAGFPSNLYQIALWNRETTLTLRVPILNPRSGSVVVGDFQGDYVATEVRASSLDRLSGELGPFKKCVIWMDVEYSEYIVLQGMSDLLDRGEILMINLETFDNLLPDISDYLNKFDLYERHRWNQKSVGGRSDVIFTKGARQ